MSARPIRCDGVAGGAQLALKDAQSHLATAEDALNGWYTRQHSMQMRGLGWRRGERAGCVVSAVVGRTRR